MSLRALAPSTPPAPPRQVALRQVLASLVIAGVLGFQGFAVLEPLCFHRIKEEGYLWPFVDYPMYREARYAGQSINRFTVVGTLADGTDVRLTPETLHLTIFQYHGGLMPAMVGRDVQEVRTYLEPYRAAASAPLIRVRLENDPVYVTASGGVPGPVQVWSVVPLANPDGSS